MRAHTQIPTDTAATPFQGVLQRACACGAGKAGPTGECADCRRKQTLQPKLTVNPPGDRFEQEADHVAERVLRMPDDEAEIQRAPLSIQRLPSVEQRQAEEEEEEMLQTKAEAGAAHAGRQAPPVVHEVLRAPGRSLDGETRSFMERRFGHDFSGVRVHAGGKASASARSVGARAYTVGRDVVFGAGQYAPGTTQGRRLLAHELTHVVQQGYSKGEGSCCVVGPDPGRGLMAGVQDVSARAVFRSRRMRSSSSPRMLQREVPELGIGKDPLHAPLIEDYRRRHGFPPGGVDEMGTRVGPSDAEIKYVLLPAEAVPPPCPDVENLEARKEDFKDPAYRKIFTDINCLSSASQAMKPACRFTAAQNKALEKARQEAARRAERGLKVIGAGKVGVDFTREKAAQLFGDEPPKVKEVVTRLRAVRDFLTGGSVRFAGRTCGDASCQESATAYVDGPRSLPIHICPTAFSRPSELHRTVLHEALHWTGLDADPSTPEGYCKKFDCVTPCHNKEVADAWAHFLDCLGQPLETRKSFKDKIIESVNDMP